MNHFQFFKLLCVLFLLFFIYQCEDTINDPALSDSESTTLLKGGKGGGGGNGGNGGGGNAGTTDYGDLVVCERNEDGVAAYEFIPGEHDPYFLIPIKFDVATEYPFININGDYETFSLNEVGEVISEEGFIVKEVEFGRLNLIRAPQAVLDAALQEAITGLTQPGVNYITTDASGRLIAIIGEPDWTVNYDNDPNNDEDNDKTIDSPRENMAIYQYLMNNGFGMELSFLTTYFSGDDVIDLAIGALAAGADKTGNMNVDELAFMNDWILDWNNLTPVATDVKGRNYFDYTSFVYDRESVYRDKCVRIRTLNSNNTWDEEFVSLMDIGIWTPKERLMDWSNGTDRNITGFANAVDDAIQVLEFIHESDLIVYSPHFVSIP